MYDICKQHLRYASVCLYVAGVKHQVVCMTFAGSTCGMQVSVYIRMHAEDV